jgi:adenylosuccinate lyase
MRANLEATGGFVLSEALMLLLAEKIGKQTAHQLVYDTAMAAHTAKRPLKQAVLENENIRAQLTTQEIENVFDYRLHTGQCGAMVERVIKDEG